MERLGRFELVKRLGTDIAEVWLAREGGQTVVVKRVLGADESFPAFFRQEMAKVARLSQPNILPVLSFDTEGLSGYWAVGYQPGHTLAELSEEVRADGGPLALLICSEVARALAHAHGQGVFHLGLLPSKVHLSPKGEVRVADFGVASIALRLPSQHGALVRGEPAYMSPEQADGSIFDLDGRSDVFTLAVILAELLTGSRLFTGTPSEILHAVARFQLPQERLSELPADLRSLLEQALVRDREQRTASAPLLQERLTASLGKAGVAEARATLQALLLRMEPPPEAPPAGPPEDEPSVTELRPRTPPAPPGSSRRISRRLLLVLTGAIGLALLVALGIALARPSPAKSGDARVAGEVMAEAVCTTELSTAGDAETIFRAFLAKRGGEAEMARVARTPSAQPAFLRFLHARLGKDCPERNTPAVDLLAGWLIGRL